MTAACGQGCSQCSDTTGVCTSCLSGFTLDNADRTRCNPPTQVQTSGQICPSGSFSTGSACAVCDSACGTCTGPSSRDCTTCAQGRLFLNGLCVTANADGVCDGSNLIADNLKRKCDSCGAKCTSCRIPNFTAASTIEQRQCTACIPGFFLSNGECVESCPDGTFVDSDLRTCRACDSTCRTCINSATFCLSCPSNLLAASGRCVANCPSSSFPSPSGNPSNCLTCHPDCTSCSGPSFNQCTACPPSRPVLLNGRCLPTCQKAQYFDTASSECRACDSSCSSCSGPGPNNCLACASSTNVLRNGQCVAANCNTGGNANLSPNVIAGLGVCLSELVVVPTPSGTAAPLPTVSGLDTPTVKKFKLEWWQILLMVLGCLFIFCLIFWFFWRRYKKKREEKASIYIVTSEKPKSSWFSSFAGKVKGLFRRTPKEPTVGGKKILVLHPSTHGTGYSSQPRSTYKLNELGAAEEARSGYTSSSSGHLKRYEDLSSSTTKTQTQTHTGSRTPYISPPMRSVDLENDQDDDLIRDMRSFHPERRAPSPQTQEVAFSSPSLTAAAAYARSVDPSRGDSLNRANSNGRYTAFGGRGGRGQRRGSVDSRFSDESIYSQMTGVTHVPRTPGGSEGRKLTSKFSMSTLGAPMPTRKEKQKKNGFW